MDLDNKISAQNAITYLGVSQRMVEQYLQQLKDQEVLWLLLVQEIQIIYGMPKKVKSKHKN
jgi:hypothetical protein